MNNNVNFRIGDVRFNYRMVGVTINNNKVLLHQVEGNKFWSLPGGRCAIDEDTKYALGREYAEEMGQEAELVRPLWFIEYFYVEKAKEEKIHEISLAYEVKLPEKLSELTEFEGDEAGKKIIFKWFELDKLEEVEFYPIFMKEKLKKLPETMEIITYRAD